MNKNFVLPTQRTSEPPTVTASGFEHLPLHEMTSATSARVSSYDDNPIVMIDLTKVDQGNVQHPDRKFKHKARAATVATRNHVTAALQEFASDIDDGASWVMQVFGPDIDPWAEELEPAI